MPEESHGQRRLAGYSPWGCKESDVTERLQFTYLLFCYFFPNTKHQRHCYQPIFFLNLPCLTFPFQKIMFLKCVCCCVDSLGKNTGVGCHFLLQCVEVKSEREVIQSCSTLSDPMDCSPPGSSVHGIFQARVLEWCAIAFSDHFIVV